MFLDLSIERIRAYRLAQGWSVRRLAKAAGINEATIRHIDSPEWSPTANTLRRLESIIPEGADWPAGVARPLPSSPPAASACGCSPEPVKGDVGGEEVPWAITPKKFGKR